MDRNHDFQGRYGIVCGAASGIGAATASILASRGAAVALADLNRDALHKKASKIEEQGGKVLSIPTDVTQQNQVERMASRAVAEWGRIDFLVNSAAILGLTAFSEISAEEWDKHIGVNLRGCFLTCHAVVPHMIAQGSGAIVNVSSGAGRSASITGAAYYSSSKAGQLGLGRHLAQELGPHGIRVNNICPGVTVTPMVHEFISPERQERIAQRIPLRRLAQPEDPALAIAFLLSDEASYINGATLDINGGRQMY